ncbi:unnamed protein product [Schistosoma mattheei]|uniref:Uncharacterized protein n=1 Tax=Schistosoma mattheei TaxID=31246 RepID=A0A183PI43_9TREM|nr:unnamed protein product [Schistosoma mattheei]
MQLDDLDFADDLALLSQTQQQMQEKTNSVAAASVAVGLNAHKGISKILRYNTNGRFSISVSVSNFSTLPALVADYNFTDVINCFEDQKKHHQMEADRRNDLTCYSNLPPQHIQGKTIL